MVYLGNFKRDEIPFLSFSLRSYSEIWEAYFWIFSIRSDIKF